MTQQVLFEQEFTQRMAYAAMGKGREYFKHRKWDDAVHEFRKAVEMNPRSAKARHWLAQAYSVSDPNFSFRSKRSIDNAIDEYRNAIELDPDFGPSHAHLANLYHVHKGMVDESIAEYEKAIDLGGLDAEDEFIVHNNLGFIYRQKNMYEAALRCFSRAASLKPGMRYVLWKIATLYAVQGKASESVNFLQQAVKAGENPGRIHKSNGWFNNIRHTSEFQSFLLQMGNQN